MPLRRAIKDQDIENFSFELIKTVEYIDEQHLLIIESCYMDKYDSISMKLKILIIGLKL